MLADSRSFLSKVDSFPSPPREVHLLCQQLGADKQAFSFPGEENLAGRWNKVDEYGAPYFVAMFEPGVGCFGALLGFPEAARRSRHAGLRFLDLGFRRFPCVLPQGAGLGVVAWVKLQGAIPDPQRAVAQIVQQGAVMGDQHSDSPEHPQLGQQQPSGIGIQVIAGFIQQEDIRIGPKCCAHLPSFTLSARKCEPIPQAIHIQLQSLPQVEGGVLHFASKPG